MSTVSELSELLRERYGISPVSLVPLREGGGQTYVVEAASKYLLKVIGAAFGDTARQSVSVMRYLEEKGFPVPRTVLTRGGQALTEASLEGEERLILLQEYLAGDEPDLEARAEEVGSLVGRLHSLLDRYPGALAERDEGFFIGRYLEILRKKNYPRLSACAELGARLWQRVRGLPRGNCHGDLHRGNLLETADGRIYVLDFDTVCRAPVMFDVMVLCDMTDYFHLRQAEIDRTKAVYAKFLTGYSAYRDLRPEEVRSFSDWVAVRHFQLQATIVELYGPDCIDERFIDAQLAWLEGWLRAAGEGAEGVSVGSNGCK